MIESEAVKTESDAKAERKKKENAEKKLADHKVLLAQEKAEHEKTKQSLVELSNVGKDLEDKVVELEEANKSISAELTALKKDK